MQRIEISQISNSFKLSFVVRDKTEIVSNVFSEMQKSLGKYATLSIIVEGPDTTKGV